MKIDPQLAAEYESNFRAAAEAFERNWLKCQEQLQKLHEETKREAYRYREWRKYFVRACP